MGNLCGSWLWQLAKSCVSQQKVERAFSQNICGSMRGRYRLPLTLYRCPIIFTHIRVGRGRGKEGEPSITSLSYMLNNFHENYGNFLARVCVAHFLLDKLNNCSTHTHTPKHSQTRTHTRTQTHSCALFMLRCIWAGRQLLPC